MTTINHPSVKDAKHLVFDVRLDWLDHHKGVLTANDASGPVYVATPPAFGGEGREWSPEHLFLGAISSCFMSTYLYFVQKMNFSITHLECETIGQIELVEGKYSFTHITVFPKIFVSDGTLAEIADLALIKAERHCLISNALSVKVEFRGKVIRK